MGLPEKPRAERQGLHALHRIGQRIHIAHDLGDILMREVLVIGVEHIVERALGSLDLCRKQRLLAHVHRQVHLRIRHETGHAHDLAEFARAAREQQHRLIAQIQR